MNIPLSAVLLLFCCTYFRPVLSAQFSLSRSWCRRKFTCLNELTREPFVNPSDISSVSCSSVRPVKWSTCWLQSSRTPHTASTTSVGLVDWPTVVCTVAHSVVLQISPMSSVRATSKSSLKLMNKSWCEKCRWNGCRMDESYQVRSRLVYFRNSTPITLHWRLIYSRSISLPHIRYRMCM